MEKHTDNTDNRDTDQRSLGFVGLSAMVHVGILIGIALAPSIRSQLGTPLTAQAGEEVSYAGTEIADPAAPTSEKGDGPSEVLLAEPGDASAVSLPAAVASEEAAPTVEPVAPATPVVKAEAPKPAPVAKPKQLSTPEVVSARAAPVMSDDGSDIAIKAALETARTQQDLPKELDAPAMEEEVPQATAAATPKEESPVEAPSKETTTETTNETTSGTTQAAPTEVASPAGENDSTKSPAENATESAAKNSAASTAQSGGTGAELTAPNANGSGTAGKSAGGEEGKLGLPTGNTMIRDVRELIAMPGNPKPSYPLQDKLSGKQGTTVLVGKVQQNGRVSNIVVEQSSGSRLMDEAAAKAFANWRFRPGQEGMVRSPVKFQLVGEAKEIPSRLRTQ